MTIDKQATDRLVRNLLEFMFGGSPPTDPDHIASYCVGEWGLDIQDVATVLRFVSGECSDGQGVTLKNKTSNKEDWTERITYP